MSALRIESFEDLGDAIECRLRIADPRFTRTSSAPGIAEEIVRTHPGLRRHRCECGSAHGIEAELADTETAHLVEHVALELMALNGAPRTLRGETSWDFKSDGRGVFRVRLGYDLRAGAPREMAEHSMREATGVVEALMERMCVR